MPLCCYVAKIVAYPENHKNPRSILAAEWHENLLNAHQIIIFLSLLHQQELAMQQ